MGNVILGLLQIAPQSLYDHVKAFEAGVALFYRASTGSIKRALDGLLERGHVEVESVEPGGRRRKVYRVTDAGRAAFREWMTGEPTGADAEAAALPRLFFLGMLPEPERAPVLARIVARVESDLAALEGVAERIDAMDVPPEHRDLSASQRATLDYGIGSHRFALEWFRAHADSVARTGAGSAERGRRAEGSRT